MLKRHKRVVAWKIADIKGINPFFYTHKILMENSYKSVIYPRKQLNPNMKKVVKVEVIKFLDAWIIYLTLDNAWVSSVQMVP